MSCSVCMWNSDNAIWLQKLDRRIPSIFLDVRCRVWLWRRRSICQDGVLSPRSQQSSQTSRINLSKVDRLFYLLPGRACRRSMLLSSNDCLYFVVTMLPSPTLAWGFWGHISTTTAFKGKRDTCILKYWFALGKWMAKEVNSRGLTRQTLRIY